VIIVGDACTDDTAEQIRHLSDARVRFVNLRRRGRYPADAKARWQVAGSVPLNLAMRLAEGEWLAHLDDDDVWTPDRLERTLEAARRSQAEMVYALGDFEVKPNEWVRIGQAPPRTGTVPHSSVLCARHLKAFRYDTRSYRINKPTDGDRWERMRRAGVRMHFLDRVVTAAPLRPGEDTIQSVQVQNKEKAAVRGESIARSLADPK
jgi:glycosyltransferase involved in cell wall biosynthesis